MIDVRVMQGRDVVRTQAVYGPRRISADAATVLRNTRHPENKRREDYAK